MSDTLSKQLRKAIKSGDLSTLARLCATSSKSATAVLLAKGPSGNSSLHLVAVHGHVDILKLLLKLGAEPDKENDYGWTPLMFASFYGHVHICELLLNIKSVNPDRVNALSLNALKCSIYKGHIQITEMLLEHGVDVDHGGTAGPGLTALMIACKVKNHAAVSALLSRCADCNYQCKTNGWTAFFYAIHPEDYSLVRILLNSRAEPNLQDWSGRTAMDLAMDLKCDMDAMFGAPSTKDNTSSIHSSFAQISISELPSRQNSDTPSTVCVSLCHGSYQITDYASFVCSLISPGNRFANPIILLVESRPLARQRK
jgi:ankyrin repeat protein